VVLNHSGENMTFLKKRAMPVIALMPFALFLFLVSTSFAQRGMISSPLLSGLFHPKVGAGAIYEVTDPAGQKSEMEIAVVGKEDVGGTAAYWMEISFAGGASSGSVMKYLVAPQGDSIHVYRLIMKSGQTGAMEMPEMMMARMNEGMKGFSSDEKAMGKNLGTEVIMTKLGPKSCTHWQKLFEGGTSDVWVNMDVYPNAMVKSITKMKDGTRTMELIRTTSDAKTKITEPPQKVPSPGMPPGR
jgi:hypothetical protein